MKNKVYKIEYNFFGFATIIAKSYAEAEKKFEKWYKAEFKGKCDHIKKIEIIPGEIIK